MAKLELKESTQRKSVDFEPVTLQSGVEVHFSQVEDGEKREYRGRAVKGEKEIGTASYTTGGNRIFLNVHPVSEIGEAESKEVAETLLSGLLSMFNK